MLTPEQVERFHRDGYLVVPNFCPPSEAQALRHRGLELVEQHDPSTSLTMGSDTNTTHPYFLESANTIGFFFEKGALDENGHLTKPPAEAINKLGHAMHSVDPVFRKWAHSPAVSEILRDLGYKKPLPVQSLFHFKAPGIGSEVPLHQDGSYLASEPQTVVGLWLALEDATTENGCMYVLPGGHAEGIHRKFLHVDGETRYEGELPQYDKSTFVPVEAKTGTLVLLHAAIPHFSYDNRSAHSRHAFVLHVVEGAPGHTWLSTNWLQRRPDFPFQPLYDDTAKAVE